MEATLSAVRLALALVGISLLGFGAWLWWQPAGYIAAGALLVVAALASEAAAARRTSKK